MNMTFTTGWGQYLSKYITAPVVNEAMGGRSARSYTREGRFTTIIGQVKSGDYVVIGMSISLSSVRFAISNICT